MIHSANLTGPRYLLHVSSAFGLSFRSQSSELSMVILYSWLCLSEITMPSIQKSLIIGLLYVCSLLSGLSLSLVFRSILGEVVCMQHIDNSTADSLSRTAHAMQGFILYYGFQHYEFLGISSALLHSLKEVLLIISPSQLTYIIQNEWVLWSSGSILL